MASGADLTRRNSERKFSSVVKLPYIRQNTCPCDFQKKKNTQKDVKHKHDERPKTEVITMSPAAARRKALTDKLPDIMAKLKTELGTKAFITKSRQAVERRKRVERPWVKGNEISAFYQVWQTSEDHVTDQRVRSQTIQRRHTIPRSLRLYDSNGDPPKKSKEHNSDISNDFGIVRDCCAQPRLRVKVFPD